MDKIIIYKITNKITNKCYVGLTSRTIEYRWYMHSTQKNGCRRLSNSINKHGKDNFTIEEVYICFDIEHANEMEDYFIKHFNSLSPNGYNLREGGKYGKVSDETKKLHKISQEKRWSDLDLREQYSEYMTKRWASGNNKGALKGITKYIEKKKRAVVGFELKTEKVLRFDNISSAQSIYGDIPGCLIGRAKTGGGCCWFYDIGQNDEQLKNDSLNIIKNKRSNWKNRPEREDRLKKMREGTSHRFKSIVRVDLFDFSIHHYENVNDATRAGFSTTGMYSSLKGKIHYSHKNIWFYNAPDIDFIELAKKRLETLKVSK